MKKLTFQARINAPRQTVWDTLWSDADYRQWTTAFCEGSHAVTDNWKQGTEVRFLDPNGCGMVSRVAVNDQPRYMSFEHLGEVRNGIEDRTSEGVKAWAGAHETYTLAEVDGATELWVEMDSTDEMEAMFAGMWPKAMDNIKALAEAKVMVV